MVKSRQRIYSMSLKDFHRYLGDKRRELRACFKAAEKVQSEFNDIFEREMAAWQKVFGQCYPRVAAQRGEMPPVFAALIDRVEAEEQARIRQEIVDHGKQVTDGRLKMDQLLSEAQAATEALRLENPDVNEREERLKSRIVRYQDEFAQAFEEIEEMEASSMGWLTNSLKIRRLKKAQKMAKKEQARHLVELRNTRQQWLEQVEEAGDTQAKLRGEWQETGVKVSEAQSRRDHLEAHLDTLAEQAAIQRVLEELQEPPQVTGELGESLRDLVVRNKTRLRYEKGLGAAAEALGYLKGMGDGLDRFRRSVGAVLREQRRYSLAKVTVSLPASVVSINQIWKQLQARIDDEKRMGQEPRQFADLVDKHITKRLTDETIKGFFETMGHALNAATAAWG